MADCPIRARFTTYDVIADVNPVGLEEKCGAGIPKRPKRTVAVKCVSFCNSIRF